MSTKKYSTVSLDADNMTKRQTTQAGDTNRIQPNVLSGILYGRSTEKTRVQDQIVSKRMISTCLLLRDKTYIQVG